MIYVFSAVPGAPTSLLVTNPNLDSLTLEWSPPHVRNGRITGYTLKYQPGEAFCSIRHQLSFYIFA